MYLFFFFFALVLSAPSHAFVFLTGVTEARLPVSSTSPTATFYWDGSYPRLQNVNEVLSGRWASLSDHDIMKNALAFALNAWSEVPGSYLRYALVEEAGVTVNASDGKNVIVVKHDSNLTSAAFAQPTIHGSKIFDCDISVADKTVSLQTLVYILTHELGHCLGLGHNHGNYGAIMGYSRSQRAFHLGADDMAGLIYLYPDPNYSSGKTNYFGACGDVKSLRQKGRGGRAAQGLAFLLPLLFAGFFLRRNRP